MKDLYLWGKSNEKAERNAEILKAREEGATYKELAELYGIAPGRVQQICAREKLIRAAGGQEALRKKKEEERKEQLRQRKEQKKEQQKLQKEWERINKRFAVRNGAGEMFLTEIERTGIETVYYYSSRNIADALLFTLAEAKQIARERHAVVCYVK